MEAHDDNFQESEIGHLVPADLLLEELVRKIGIDTIARIPGNDVVVVEDDPKGGAQALPEHDELLSSFRNRMAQFTGTTPSPIQKTYAQIFGMRGQLDQWGLAPDTSKLRLVVQSALNSIDLSLEGFALSGQRTFTSKLFVLPTLNSIDNFQELRRNSAKVDTRWVPLSVPQQ